MTPADRAQFARFESIIDEWRATRAFAVPSLPGHARGSAGKHAKSLDALDAQTADAWLRAQGLSSAAVRWWVEYGLRDDYGASLSQASAWANMRANSRWFVVTSPTSEPTGVDSGRTGAAHAASGAGRCSCRSSCCSSSRSEVKY